MLRWDWRPACERRGGVWECVCTTVLWGRGLYDDFEFLFFFLGEGWYNYSTLAYLTRNPRAVCAAIFVLAHLPACGMTSAATCIRVSSVPCVVLSVLETSDSRGGWCLPVRHASDLRTLSAVLWTCGMASAALCFRASPVPCVVLSVMEASDKVRRTVPAGMAHIWCGGPRDRFPPHCLRHCTTCSNLSASLSLRRSEALGVVLAALEAQPSQWCGGPQDRRTPVASSVSLPSLCAAVGVVAVCRTVQHNVPSLGLTHPATTPVAGPMCVPNDRPLSGLPWHPSAGCHSSQPYSSICA